MGDLYRGPDTQSERQQEVSTVTSLAWESISDAQGDCTTPAGGGKNGSDERLHYQSSSTNNGFIDVLYSPIRNEAAPSPRMKRNKPTEGEVMNDHDVKHDELSAKAASNVSKETGRNSHQKLSQQSFSLGRTQCMIAGVVIVCVFVVVIVIVAVGFYFMGAHLCSPAVSATAESDPNAASTATATTTAETAVSGPSTVLHPMLPMECLNATNFTRSWRTDIYGSDIRPGFGSHSKEGYACDLHADLGWFRFTGEAGNRMLDSCPSRKSCGAYYPIWSDAEHPEQVGVISPIFAYSRYSSDCRRYVYTAQVMRCSDDTNHDYIYKYTGAVYGTCRSAFCGMYGV